MYTIRFIDRGWIPHDEGTIGQSAERVLAGQVPHRDFDEVYTGGLTYLHAAGMKVFGMNLRAPRLVLFLFFMPFLATVFAISRRVASPHAGFVAMALITVWSVPNYFVSLPSWYNLFFATFGVLAFLRFLETNRRRWLLVAGLCGGLSLLVKIAGLFYLVGGVLFLTYVEQTFAAAADGATFRRSTFWPIAAMPAALVLLVGLALAGSQKPELLQLIAPAFTVCAFVAWREWTQGPDGFLSRFRRLAGLAWPFAAGAALPVAAFVLLLWQLDGVADLIRGVFVLPQRRLVEASASPPALATVALAVPYGLLLITRRRHPIPKELLVAVMLAGLFGLILAFGAYPLLYRISWATARAMFLGAAVAGVWVVATRPFPGIADDVAHASRMRVFLLVAIGATVGLGQIPYATPTYFFYVAPMVVLAIVAIVFAQPLAPTRIHLVVASFFFLFAIMFTNRSYGWNLGVTFLPYDPPSKLDLARGGLWVPEEDKRTYEELVLVLQQHAVGGTIFAGPDCPEVYFLSGFPNPTRAFFDFLTPQRQDQAWMAKVLARSPVRAAVVNTAPLFSPPLDPEVLRMLEQRFPSSRQIGRFIVRFD